MASPRPVSDALAALVAKGALTCDSLQQAAAATLDRVAADLVEKPRGILDSLFGKPPRAARGAYLVGQVGRGKTMLMDLFFET
ncbi:MAG: cell division protein ZapE, partial [Hyphomicrobiales bacterium]